MKWKDVKKYKINLEQAEENGGFIVFEEYEDWQNYDLTFGLFSDLEAAKVFANEIQRGTKNKSMSQISKPTLWAIMIICT